MTVLFVTGTGTGVGKTIVTAALAAVAGSRSVAVVKPAQTGVEPGEPADLADVARLAGPIAVFEPYRFPDPLAPTAAARRCGLPPVDLVVCADLIRSLATAHDLVIVEGAGGLLVPLDSQRRTLADLAAQLSAPLVLVTDPSLGTLNHTALTLEALDNRSLICAGVVLGSWPQAPDLACRTNLEDLESLIGGPILGALPAGLGAADPPTFAAAARAGLAPALGGRFDAADFRRTHQI